LRLAVFFVFLATLPAAAIAQELSFFQKMELKNACEKDMETLCGTTERGDGRLLECIRQNVEKLSQPCHDTIAKLRGDLLAEAPMDF
jgi:hypothetical protein